MIAGLILAAGASRRMGTPKALLEYRGETFLDRLIGIFSAVCDQVIVVLGHEAERIRSESHRLAQSRVAINPDPGRGMLSSLQCGLRELAESTHGVMFTLVDHPAIESTTPSSLVEAFSESGAPLTVPVYDGRRGHPVCITRAVADELLALPLTAQAPDVLRRYRDAARLVPVNDPGVVEDVDDPAAYAKLLETAARR